MLTHHIAITDMIVAISIIIIMIVTWISTLIVEIVRLIPIVRYMTRIRRIVINT